MKIFFPSLAFLIFLATQATAQETEDFLILLERSQEKIESGQLTTEKIFLNIHLARLYMRSSIDLQSNFQASREITEAERVFEVISRPNEFQSMLQSMMLRRLGRSDLVRIDQSFQARIPGFRRVLADVADRLSLPTDSIEGVMLDSLAFYAVSAAMLADRDIFQPGEFCVFPFWPFC